MKTIFKEHKMLLLYVLPTMCLCLYFLMSSFSHSLHDFSNSYFSARLVHEQIPPETVIFDIYKFNSYIWDLGYTNELVDYYVNSPFTLAAFYPLAFIEDAYVAKTVFNSLSILCFLIALVLLASTYLKKNTWLLLFVPLLFYVPIRNNILFGQSYFMILFFVVFGFYLFEKQKFKLGAGFFSVAVLLKFFPAFYGLPLLFKTQWKAILWGVISGIVLCAIAIAITGVDLWTHYFFDVLPNTLLGKTATDYRFNYQSLDVFFKTLFVQDAYYNPEVLFANERIYIIANWTTKAFILGCAIFASIKKKTNLFLVLAIWVATLFLLQSRTATYAQILWLIPLVVIYKSEIQLKYKLIFTALLFLICNVPFHKMAQLPVLFQFSRLWLVLILVSLFYWMAIGKVNFRYVLYAAVLLFPLHIGAFYSTPKDPSHYVLDKKEHFMIYNISEKNRRLTYGALGKDGAAIYDTDIMVSSFDESAITIKEHQLFLGDKQLTFNTSLKKQPVLVNDCMVYFLTDHHSRRAAFTIKEINICDLLK